MHFIPIVDASKTIKAQIRNLRNQEDVRKYMYTSHEISEAEHEMWLASLIGNHKQNVFVVMLGGEPAGVVSLNAISSIHKSADWAFYIDGSLQGKGLGSRIEFWMLDYAFGEAGLEKLNCEVLETNPSVIKMHQKFGFSIEGVRRKNILHNGERIDVVLLGITSSEWNAHRSKMLTVIERLNR